MIPNVIGILLYLLLVGLVIFRMFKYKFQKLNIENFVLIHLAALMAEFSDLQTKWFYLLLAPVVALLMILLAGIVKTRKNMTG